MKFRIIASLLVILTILAVVYFKNEGSTESSENHSTSESGSEQGIRFN